jgi:hypothetical protein
MGYMSGECEKCGEHTLECKCGKCDEMPRPIPICPSEPITISIDKEYLRNELNMDCERKKPNRKATLEICPNGEYGKIYFNTKKGRRIELDDLMDKMEMILDMKF